MIEYLQNLDPIAFSIGSLVIRWYSLAYMAGFILGWQYAIRLALYPSQNTPHPNRDMIDDYLPWAILGTILGGRLGFVLFYQPEYYLDHPLEALMVWQGGMSFHGGLLGVVVSCLLFTQARKIPFWRFSDIMCCVAPIGLFFGRIANFINGELYGKVTTHSWGMIFDQGGPLPRHPSQLYEALLEGIILFLILFFVYRFTRLRNHHGFCAGLFFAAYGLFRFGVEFVREPDAHIGYIANILTMGQILCVPMIIFGATVMFLSYKKHA